MSEMISLNKFFADLLSNDWERRLYAYSVIENDLKGRGFNLSEERWEHLMLLAGQIISIYFKKKPSRDTKDFEKRLTSLYQRLLSSISLDKSKDYRKTQELLTDIYDDDDDSARADIAFFFKKKVDAKETVLFNLLRCYEYMMQKVLSRTMNPNGVYA